MKASNTCWSACAVIGTANAARYSAARPAAQAARASRALTVRTFTRPTVPSRPSRSGGLRLRQAQLLHCRVAHLELLDLAGDGHRELVDEQHVLRHLVVGDLVGAVLAQLVL